MKVSPRLSRSKSLDPYYAAYVCVVLIFVAALLGGIFSACSDTATHVTAAAVQLGDKYASSNDGADDSDVVEFHVAPASQPAAPAASQPSTATTPTPAVSVELDGRQISTPAGMSIDYRRVTHNKAIPATTTLERHASATGPSLETDKDAGNFDAKPPTVELKDVDVKGPDGTGLRRGGSNAAGGAVAFSWTAAAKQALASMTGELWLWGLGIACIAGGLGYAAVERFMGGLIDWQLVIGAEVAGIAVIATAITAQDHPGVFVFLFLVLVAVIVWYVWEWKKKQDAAAGGSTSFLGDVEAEAAKLASAVGIHLGAAPPATPTATAPPAPAK